MDESAATVSVAGSQETVMVGAIGSHFDLGSVSEWSLELGSENEGICSDGTASVCEGDVVDIDSGAEVSCRTSELTRAHYMRRGSACVEVTTLQLVAVSCVSSVQESWVWKLMTCEATW